MARLLPDGSLKHLCRTLSRELVWRAEVELACCFRNYFCASRLALVDSRIGMVIAPIEPVILQRGDAFETFAQRWAGDRAPLEVPFAGGSRIEQDPILRCGRRLSIRFSRFLRVRLGRCRTHLRIGRIR